MKLQLTDVIVGAVMGDETLPLTNVSWQQEPLTLNQTKSTVEIMLDAEVDFEGIEVHAKLLDAERIDDVPVKFADVLDAARFECISNWDPLKSELMIGITERQIGTQDFRGQYSLVELTFERRRELVHVWLRMKA